MLAFHATGTHLTLIRETPSRIPFGKVKRDVIAFEDWVLHRPDAATSAIARLLQASGDGEAAEDGSPLVEPDADGAILHPALIARLTDSEAQALGLPLATRLSLNLATTGLIHKQGFRISTHWTRTGGVPVRAVLANGYLRQDGRLWRVPEPLFSTLAAVDMVNAAPDEAGRQEALAALKQAIGDEGAAQIAPDRWEAMDEVDHVVGNHDKLTAASWQLLGLKNRDSH